MRFSRKSYRVQCRPTYCREGFTCNFLMHKYRFQAYRVRKVLSKHDLVKYEVLMDCTVFVPSTRVLYFIKLNHRWGWFPSIGAS